MVESKLHNDCKKKVASLVRKLNLEVYEEVPMPSMTSTKMRNLVDYMMKLKEELRKRGQSVEIFGFGRVGFSSWRREFGRPIIVDVVAWRSNDVVPVLAVECSVTSTLEKELRNLKETLAQVKVIVDCVDGYERLVDGIPVYSIASFERRSSELLSKLKEEREE
jgi:hypothetical protein